MEEREEAFSKISIPEQTGIFLSKRVMRLIDNGRKKRAIWIHGPAGSGKTTLVAGYLRERKLPCLWYQADKNDANISSLFYYLKIAAKELFIKKRVSLPLLTPEYMPGIDAFTRRFFKILYSEIKPPFVLVFDNYHEVGHDALFHQALFEGLSNIPDNITIMFISRATVHRTFSQFIRSQRMKIIGWNDLCLTPTESKEIIRIKSQKELPDNKIKLLYDMTQGWVAGLTLMLENVDNDNIADVSFIDTAPEIMFDYFANEIFNRMDRQTQDFLCKTAYLHHMTTGMAEKLTTNVKASQILAHLSHNNFFTQMKHIDSGHMYQYHPLFRKFLIIKSRDTIKPTDLLKFKQLAATILEESGQVSEAAELFCELKDWEHLARLICRHAERMVLYGMDQSILEWLNYFPDKFIEKNPWLVYWQGVTILPTNPSKSLVYFESAFALFRKNSDKNGTLQTIFNVFNAIIHESKDFTLLDRWINITNQFRDELQISKPGRIEPLLIPVMFTSLVFRQPDHHTFDWWKEAALSLLKTITDNNYRVLIAWSLGIHYYWAGDTTNSKIMSEILQRASISGKGTPLFSLYAQVIDVSSSWANALFETALVAVDKGMEISRTTGVYLWDLQLLAFGVASAIGTGDLETARRLLGQMEPEIAKGTSNFNVSVYHVMVCWEALLKEDPITAKMHAEICLRFSLELQATLPLASAYHAIAQVSHELGEDKKADAFLEKSFAVGLKMKSTFIEFMCRIAEAQFALDRDQNEKAIMLLRKALKLGKEKNHVNFFLWRSEIMAKICVVALNNDIEKEYVQSLIQKRGLIPATPPVEIEEWPWQLKIYTLDEFRIVINGKVMQFSGKTPKKPISMLKALITFGYKGAIQDQLEDLLWPEADGDAAHNAFSVTLKRLRELIGIDGIITLHEKRITIDPHLCWVDAWAFEQLVTQTDFKQKDITGKNSLSSIIKSLEKATDIYKEKFLEEDVEQPRAIQYGKHLRNKYIRSVINLGLYREEKGKIDKAINSYQKGLDVDSSSEEFYQRLMICYLRLGNYSKALDIYKQCQDNMNTIFAREPSDETKKIYKTILQQHRDKNDYD